jgi:hypothetical protein
MFRISVVAVVLVATTYSFAGQIEQAPRGQKVSCDITVWFSSHGGGTDRQTAEAVRRYIATSTSIERALVVDAGGREGEFSYCVTARVGQVDQEYKALQTLLPADSRFPTGIYKGSR